MRTQAQLGLLLASLSLIACAHPRTLVLSPTAPQGISVSGVGKASAPPDIARANVGVEVRAASPEQAAADSNTRMTAILQALKSAGVPEKDLRTHSYSISFEQDPVPPQPASAAAATSPRTGVYRVNNLVEATIRDLTSIGRVLKAATDAGANSVWGVNFEIDDDTALVTRARALAIADGKRAASELAQLTGTKLGEVVSVIEGEPSGYSGAPVMSMRAANTGDVPIESGELTVSYSVQIVYATQP
jgi:uncharacterized protein YggE